MSVVNEDIEITQGTDFRLDLQVTVNSLPYPVTGHRIYFILKEDYTSQAPIIELDNLLLGGVTLNNDDTDISIHITSEQTAAMDFTNGRFEIYLTDPDDVISQLVKGRCIFYKSLL